MDKVAVRPAAATGGEAFDEYYFANGCGVPYRRDDHWLTFFGGIADEIVERIHPRRVLDAGCAIGVLVETLRDRGVDALGVDISSYAIGQVYEPIRPFCRQSSIAEELADRYDLIVSIEVLEHMPAAEGEKAIANFCRHTDDVLFSSTPGDYKELTHVNVQPTEYWAEQFARHGFFRDVDFDASFITPWAVRFRRRNDPLARIVREYERKYAVLSLARHEARQFAQELQRDLAQARERMAAFEAKGERRGAPDQERAHLQQLIAQIGELLVGVDSQRKALLQSRMELDLERDRVTRALATQDDSRELAALRASLEETHANHTRKVLEVDALRAEASESGVRAHSLEHELRHARETIRLMEQSVFWRARRLLGRR
jgi:SAM-dependent methyltransferase